MNDFYWHASLIEDVAKKLKTDQKNGLSEEEAKKRLREYGPNQITEQKKKSPLLILLSQFNDIMIWILLFAAIISAFLLNEYIDAGVIAIILLANATLGFIQEYRAEQALEALKRLTAPYATVIRDKQEREIPSSELVPGDLIVLEAGDYIPADARIYQVVSFHVNEAALTGESVEINKTIDPIDKKTIPIGEKKNLAFAGTIALSGRARAIIFSTGDQTEMGKIAELIQVEEEKTPLQKELKKVGSWIAVICLMISSLVLLIGLARGFDLPLMFLTAVSLAVAAIPEGLPAIVTITLALGVQAMAKNKALVRRLHAVETLGSTDIIFTDKTGTLTENKMVAKDLFVDEQRITLPGDYQKIKDSKAFKRTIEIAVLCNNARETKNQSFLGDPTEVALLKIVEDTEFSISELNQLYPRVNEIPFDSERKEMTTVNRDNSGYLILTKGAPEIIMSKCKSFINGDKLISLNQKQRDKFLNYNDQLAKEGFRTLACAFSQKDSFDETKMEEIEKDFIFTGLIALKDPPRPEVRPAINKCNQAGIKVAMVTGDHLLTAETIGREIGLLDNRKVISGLDLDKMELEELSDNYYKYAVFARVSPLHKVKIVEAMKNTKATVAMTGDGVNDAPAIKIADIGISMGITGTDVTKEASDMILADDNFATIVNAVEEGRRIFSNLKKFILFLLSCNISEVGIMFFAMIGGLGLPLLPVQILWINLITDGFPALALGVDPPAEDIMNKPPRSRFEGILSKQSQLKIIIGGLVLTLGVLLSFILCRTYDNNNTQSVAFTTLVFAQLLHAFHFRVGSKSIFSLSLFKNKYLLLAVTFSVLLQLLIIYNPFLANVFRVYSLNLSDWFFIAIGSLGPFFLYQILKYFWDTLRKD